MKNFIKLIIFLVLLTSFSSYKLLAESSQENLKVNWSFKSFFGTFDRASLQRGYQVFNEVCSSCHSIKYLSYRNLTEKGGPEF